MNKQFSILLLLVFIVCYGRAQETLSAENAIQIALENNYEIRLAKNDLEIDEISTSLGFAGMLPQVYGTLNDNNSIQNLSQVRSDGTENSLEDAKNNSLSYGVAMDWTLFDGFKMFAKYDQLKENKKLGDVELQKSILTNVSNVLITYYDLVQQQQQLSALDSTLVISQQRVDLAQNRFTIGKASKLEVLNAKVDLNTDQTLMLRQKELYANTKVELNQLLARDEKTAFKVVDEILVDNSLFLPNLETTAKENNPELMAQVINKRIAELDLKQTRALRYPTLVATTGYNFSDSESSLGFTTSSSAHGLNYGFRVNVNVFDGFNQNRSEKIAKLKIDNSKLLIEQQEKALLSQLSIAYQTYQTNLDLIELEQNNEAIAKENLEITMQKYRIGAIPTIEFRTAQLNYINAQLRFSNANFQAKLSEIALKALSGSLPL
ncbi:outer membrane protein [Galbibacter orientalis DSM 19592]|uniref:Outer membrane protein n=1 Tax=Galbibacter orientalis DSM 19592 TaxID=926559 RepID=I3C8N7_9FLAO|nr:TolC family protein [Galbibacter orientalis]EIJ39980.1 outer membrane protein [Galbibacter orientalis DSM 19592]